MNRRQQEEYRADFRERLAQRSASVTNFAPPNWLKCAICMQWGQEWSAEAFAQVDPPPFWLTIYQGTMYCERHMPKRGASDA
jgi:hypothetical protein